MPSIITLVWSLLERMLLVRAFRPGLVGAYLLALVLHPDAIAQDAEPVQPPESEKFDASQVEGHDKCVDCHKYEFQAWRKSAHSTFAFDVLRIDDDAREIADNLGVREIDIARTSNCVNCHATRQVKQSGHLGVIPAVSCESCHNPSGGENGWLQFHASYGARGTRRQQETTEHYQSRVAASEREGQLRSANIYRLAKRCFECHVIGDEALIVKGEHPTGGRFELVEKMLGEVRHNFALGSKVNSEVSTLWIDSLHNPSGRTAAGRRRVLFIVGQLVDLEISLRYLAKATDENEFSESMLDRIGAAYETLEKEILERTDNADLTDVKKATATVGAIWEKLDVDGFDADDIPSYLIAATVVGEAARLFSKRDGNDLEAIDKLDLVPKTFDKVFQPPIR